MEKCYPVLIWLFVFCYYDFVFLQGKISAPKVKQLGVYAQAHAILQDYVKVCMAHIYFSKAWELM